MSLLAKLKTCTTLPNLQIPTAYSRSLLRRFARNRFREISRGAHEQWPRDRLDSDQTPPRDMQRGNVRGNSGTVIVPPFTGSPLADLGVDFKCPDGGLSCPQGNEMQVGADGNKQCRNILPDIRVATALETSGLRRVHRPRALPLFP